MARKLLASGLAEMVSSPIDSEVRVAPRYRALARMLRKLNRLQDLDALARQGRLWEILRRHPESIGILIKVYGNFVRDTFLRKTSSDEQEQEQENYLETIQQTVDEIRISVAQAQAVNAIQHTIEQDILRPTYLATEPYLRLRLRSSVQWFSSHDSRDSTADDVDDSGGQEIEALLLVHRSGVMQLTFPVILGTKTAEEITAESLASWSAVYRGEYCEPLVRELIKNPPKGHVFRGRELPDAREGVTWYSIDHSARPTSIADLFGLYRDAIETITNVTLDHDWLSYPVVILGKIGCCKAESNWRKRHTDELDSMLGRVTIPREEVRMKVLAEHLPTDRSITRDQSLYVGDALALKIHWPYPSHSNSPDFGQDMQTIVLVEAILLQYWQLRTLNRRIGSTQSGRSRRRVRAAQLEAIYGLDEYHESAISYGTARDLAEQVMQRLNGPKMYQRILDSLDQLQQIIVGDQERATSRRANVIATVGVLAAVVLGLPAVRDALMVARYVPNRGLGVLAEPLRELSTLGAVGAWYGYLILVVAATIVLVVVVVPKRLRRPRRRYRRPGRPWDYGTIQIDRVSKYDS